MKKSIIPLIGLLLLTATLFIVPSGCGPQPTPTPTVVYSLPELKYLLLSHFEVFWCDPYAYPISRPEQEQKDALEQFPALKADEAEFTAVLQHLGLPNRTEYSDAEKLLIFREHEKLSIAVEVDPSGSIYNFTLRVGEGQGWRYEGTVTPSGEIKVSEKEQSINTCPICLTKGTLIDTPVGPVLVDQLRKGMIVWTSDETGNRVAAVVVATVMTPVPPSFHVVRVMLADGRAVNASPGHPTVEGKTLGDYRVGDTLDGATVVGVEYVAYNGGATYDILPSGKAGLYWANGVLLKSTLAAN